ncbi:MULTISPECIES: TetR/AcrR family transcriptional regulator [unclassified Nocardioides]|uniref:TetR/AcrR family transcriptional regulator n=1 Tax=unclassified Nocardioides TaxID=2615069 RepID=UPI000701BC1B|nr:MULTISPECIES: TetR/AcrR family transcriptional regulator [unclassified Nocardioides]KRA38805.1 TetR family transcriptional regulator [Nocardioides sp. Root614]KRA92765.1 TetR family transcriptional regulator [Nocardioides sp. Root682]
MARTTVDASTTPDGRDTRWDDHRAARHERILAAAIDAIDAEGGAIGVAAIADRASVPRSVVYRLFENRDDLDEQIRTRIIDTLMADLAPALDPTGTIREAISRATTTYVGWVADHPRLQQFLGTGSATRRRTGSRVVTGTRTAIALGLVTLLESELAQLSSEPPPPGAAQNLAFGIVGLVDGSVNRWVAHPEARSSAEELVEFLTDAVWSVLSSHADRLGVPMTPDQRLVSRR